MLRFWPMWNPCCKVAIYPAQRTYFAGAAGAKQSHTGAMTTQNKKYKYLLAQICKTLRRTSRRANTWIPYWDFGREYTRTSTRFNQVAKIAKNGRPSLICQYLWKYGTGKWEIGDAKIYYGQFTMALLKLTFWFCTAQYPVEFCMTPLKSPCESKF